jgi:hypothetical protein
MLLPEQPPLQADGEMEAGGAGDTFFAKIPWLGGAIAALVRAEPGERRIEADKHVRERRHDDVEHSPLGPGEEEDQVLGCATRAASGDAHLGSAGTKHDQAGMAVEASAFWAPRREGTTGASETLTARSPRSDSSDDNNKIEREMLVCYAGETSQPPNWVIRTGRRLSLLVRPRTASHAQSSGNIQELPTSLSGTPTMVEDQANPPKSPLEGQPPRRAADAMVLSPEEQMQHEKMREEVVRNFAKQLDRLELAEKLAKATGDLGKNLGKAGDKLMNVWDLNDLKDDTIEMQEHVGEDIKEDLDKHVRGAHEAVDKAKDAMGKAMRAATPHLLENLSLRVYRDSTTGDSSDLPEGTVRQISILERVTRSLSPVRTSHTNGSVAAGRSGRDSPVCSSPGVGLSRGSSTELPLCRPESMLISRTRNGPSFPLIPPPPQPSANHDDTYDEKEMFSYVPSDVHTQSDKDESVDDFAVEGGGLAPPTRLLRAMP